MERPDRRPPSTWHSTSLPIKTRGSLPTRFIPSRPPCSKDAPSHGTRCPRCCRHSIQRRDRPPARPLDWRLGSRRPLLQRTHDLLSTRLNCHRPWNRPPPHLQQPSCTSRSNRHLQYPYHHAPTHALHHDTCRGRTSLA